MKMILKIKAVSFEMRDDGFISIQQLSTGKRVIVKVINLLALIKGKNKCFTECGIELKYNQTRQHLMSDKNYINTYLTRGFEERLVTFIQGQLRSSFKRKVV